jgi:16S rRNA A1518/A1519 N6-dimethyltransferase RsmA/KsgA/DIM1 with predicted DNA glycosylase/AP lyase activity
MEFESDENPKGQHFLVNKEVIRKMVILAEVNEKKKVFEVGAGDGNITRILAASGCDLTACEIDKSLERGLSKIAAQYKNTKIVIDSVLDESFKGFDVVIGNIPFFLSEEVVVKAIKDKVNKVVLIVGDMFVKKIQGEDKIGLISRKIFDVTTEKLDARDFDPAPNTSTYILNLTRKKEISKLDNEVAYVGLSPGKVKNAILNVLTDMKFTKNKAREIIENMKFENDVLNKPCKKITAKLLLRIESELNRIIQSDLGPSKA